MIRTRTIKAYAKINLYLDVTGRREDGYHTIESVMQQISLFDYVTVMKTDAAPGTKRISITCTDRSVPQNEENIAFRCAKAYFDSQGIDDYQVRIHIDKRIPRAAGLAGGSTDGAAVLKMLPILFDKKTDMKTLCEIAGSVGADIPFSLVGGTCLAKGTGETLTPMKRSFCCPILVVAAEDEVSTPEAYRMLDQRYGEKFSHPMETGWDAGFSSFMNSTEVPRRLYNIFESVVLPAHPKAAAVKEELLSYGAASALMSGSGPAVFGLFSSEGERDIAFDHFSERGLRAYPCQFVN